jgi:hypothetical protein
MHMEGIPREWRLQARAAAALRLYEPETPFESSPFMVWSN